MVRLAVMGVGRVGGEVSYLAASLGIVDELVLYDSASDMLNAQVLDLRQTGLKTAISTEKTDIKGADICIFSAGMPRDPSIKSRADLLDANLPVARECTACLAGFSGTLITVTNPMDVNNFYMCRTTGIPRERCIGFGGQLDSARFALALAQHGISGFSFVLGEHGEHQVPLFSMLSHYIPEELRNEILTELRGVSMEIIRGKGGTVFGPALHIVDLIRMIAGNTRELVTCSCVLEGEYGIDSCSLGVPARIGRDGIHAIEEWQLDPWEKAHMDEAGSSVRELCRKAVA